MKRGIGLILLMVIILTLMVPLSQNLLRSEPAFTCDNLIFINASYHGQ
ncbi:MAG: hypothetical protein PHQ94_00460 [Syntrophomonas sp.]|nr:hypothetical protein [Syntrophomonas sp.]